MLLSSDYRSFLALALCGLLITIRFTFFYPANLGLLFDLETHTTGGTTLLFFVWNLFLATLPYFFSRLADLTSSKLFIGFLLLLWLLFLPNAPYVISDLKHLRPRAYVPYWYDIITFISCALTGLYLGALAVINVMRQTSWSTWSSGAKWASVLLFPICGFGIFLGRVLRWNSWDAFSRPHHLFADIWSNFADPNVRPTILLFVFGYGLALLIGTWLVRKLESKEANPKHSYFPPLG